MNELDLLPPDAYVQTVRTFLNAVPEKDADIQIFRLPKLVKHNEFEKDQFGPQLVFMQLAKHSFHLNRAYRSAARELLSD